MSLFRSRRAEQAARSDRITAKLAEQRRNAGTYPAYGREQVIRCQEQLRSAQAALEAEGATCAERREAWRLEFVAARKAGDRFTERRLQRERTQLDREIDRRLAPYFQRRDKAHQAYLAAVDHWERQIQAAMRRSQ